MLMHNWRLELFSELDAAQNMHAVLEAALKAVRPFGFEHCGWRALVPQSARHRYEMLHTAKDRFVRKEQEGRYDEAPVPQHCSRSQTPISWQGNSQDPLFLKAPSLWEEYYECGHYGGWAQSLLSSEGHFSMLYMDSPYVLSPRDLQHSDTNLRWVTAAVLCRMDDVKKSSQVQLSLAERDALRWVRDGLNDVQTAERMTLSTYFVRLHLQSAMVKLQTTSRKAAIAKAMFLGLL